jgi:hypothetical protein
MFDLMLCDSELAAKEGFFKLITGWLALWAF